MRPSLLPFVLCWVALLLLLGASPPPAPAAPEVAPTVRVVTLTGEGVEGRLAGLDGERASLVTAAGERTFPLASLRRVERSDEAERSLAGLPHLRVTLTGGEVLVGTLADAASDGFSLSTPDFGRVSLPLDFVSTVVAVPPEADVCFEPEHRHLPRDDDVAYTRSGDAVAGIVLGVDERGFEIETVVRGRTRRVGWDELLVLHLQNDPAPEPTRLRVEIETTEGSRLEASGDVVAQGEALSFALRSAPKSKVKVPWSAIRVLRPSGGAFVYASRLPFRSEFTWYYGDAQGDLQQWFAARTDRRPNGCPLRLGGRTYRHGFAVHSRSTITIPTAKAWKRFETLFGVDDYALERPAGGVVDARVLGDGEVLWEAKDVRAGEEPRRIGPLDVSEVEALVLEVDFGTDLVTADLVTRDYATWADPILFR